MKEEANDWSKQAEDDLDKAKILFNNRKFDGAAFYSQQTAEKALKAVIIKTQGKLVKTHDLVILGRMAGLPKSILEKCEMLCELPMG
ncbi:HEPN domain-containing protein [Candidatus Pacearchaeota archaeon]|nr:HEPN domain-containing protein [Candidatus Pacearchaeota archaeon]